MNVAAHTRIRLIGQAAIASAIVGAALIAPATAFATKPAPDHKVTICHRTNSDTNPYVVIDVDIASSGHLKGGHDTQHEGPIWELGLKAQHVEWGDIIPPYTYGEFSYPGQNWTADGQAILAAGCELPEPAGDPGDPGDPGAPGGEVEGDTGRPEVTPPATDTISGSGDRSSDASMLFLLLAATAIVGGLSVDRARARR